MDFLTDINNELVITDGDFTINLDSNEQHIQDILYSVPGYFKEYATLGCNLYYYLNSSGKQQEIRNVVYDQLKSDGYIVEYFVVNEDGSIEIDAKK